MVRDQTSGEEPPASRTGERKDIWQRPRFRGFAAKDAEAGDTISGEGLSVS